MIYRLVVIVIDYKIRLSDNNSMQYFIFIMRTCNY